MLFSIQLFNQLILSYFDRRVIMRIRAYLPHSFRPMDIVSSLSSIDLYVQGKW